MNSKSFFLNEEPGFNNNLSGKPRYMIQNSSLLIKKGIWVYFFLLIVEGALRKWFLPGLSTPLLIVRDPVAIWVIFTAWNRQLIPSSSFLIAIMSVGVIGVLTSILFGHGNPAVAVYGARPFLIHIPLIFVIGSILNRDDVVKIGKMVLYVSIGMIIIASLQFYSPQSAWINRGVGGDMEGSGFGGALGFFRPSGTFSFTNGFSLFFSFTSCFIFYFWLNPREVNRGLLIAATIGLLAAIPISISRGLFFSILVTFIFMLFTITRNPKLISKIILAIILFLFVFAILSQTSFFQTATAAFFARFESASASEGGLEGTLIDRYLGGLVKAFNFDEGMPVFGHGLGILSNVGTTLMQGKVVGGISEGEWGRLIYESGILIGLGIIFIRLGFSLNVTLKSYSKLVKGDVLPWILLSFFLLNIPQGNWTQPTSLGFCVVIGGLLLASMNNPEIPDINQPVLYK